MGILNNFKNLMNQPKINREKKKEIELEQQRKEATFNIDKDMNESILTGYSNLDEKIYNRFNYEHWYLVPALDKKIATILPVKLLQHMNSMYNDKPYDEIFYKERFNSFANKMFNTNINEVNDIAIELESKIPNFYKDAISDKSDMCKLNDEVFKNLLYKSIAIDIINGNICDTYNLYNKYTVEVCRRALNEFPVHCDANNIDGRSINVAIAFYISYNALLADKFIDNSMNIYTIYELLLKKLNYKNIKILSMEDTCLYSGLSDKFFDIKYSCIVRNMVYSNKSAYKFINILKYLIINNITYKTIEISTSIDNIGKSSYKTNQFSAPHRCHYGSITKERIYFINICKLKFIFNKEGYYINKTHQQ